MSRCLIISAMKNEGSFILEWIAYHRAIGFADPAVSNPAQRREHAGPAREVWAGPPKFIWRKHHVHPALHLQVFKSLQYDNPDSSALP